MGIRCVVNDGASHAVDSSEMAFKTAALMGFREAYAKSAPTILEPIMKVEIDAPNEFQGSVVGQVNQRRGVILETVGGDSVSITCEVPLNAMFGYSTDLRSATQGKGTFTMEFAKYADGAEAGAGGDGQEVPREGRGRGRSEIGATARTTATHTEATHSVRQGSSMKLRWTRAIAAARRCHRREPPRTHEYFPRWRLS